MSTTPQSTAPTSILTTTVPVFRYVGTLSDFAAQLKRLQRLR